MFKAVKERDEGQQLWWSRMLASQQENQRPSKVSARWFWRVPKPHYLQKEADFFKRNFCVLQSYRQEVQKYFFFFFLKERVLWRFRRMFFFKKIG